MTEIAPRIVDGEPTCSGEECPAWKVETIMIPNDMGVEWRETHAHCTLGGAFPSAACVPMLRRLLATRTEECIHLNAANDAEMKRADRLQEERDAARRELCEACETIGYYFLGSGADRENAAASRGWSYLYAPAPPATGTEEGGEG